MHKLIFLLLGLVLSLVASSVTQAAIFDAADYIEPGRYSLGAYGEFLLNNPSGEGIEIRGKRGINDMVNVEPFIGFGNKNRGFRFGAAVPINFFPDAASQPGISLLLTAQHLKRETYSALQFSAAPLFHKTVEGVDQLPLNLFLGFPFSLELFDGSYKTGLQLAFGGLYDMTRDGTYFLASEAGVSLNKSESLVLLGGGIRFNGARENSRAVSWKNSKQSDRDEPQPNVNKTRSVDDSEEYEPEEN